jgi:hypothetical protein
MREIPPNVISALDRRIGTASPSTMATDAGWQPARRLHATVSGPATVCQQEPIRPPVEDGRDRWPASGAASGAVPEEEQARTPRPKKEVERVQNGPARRGPRGECSPGPTTPPATPLMTNSVINAPIKERDMNIAGREHLGPQDTRPGAQPKSHPPRRVPSVPRSPRGERPDPSRRRSGLTARAGRVGPITDMSSQAQRRSTLRTTYGGRTACPSGLTVEVSAGRG